MYTNYFGVCQRCRSPFNMGDTQPTQLNFYIICPSCGAQHQVSRIIPGQAPSVTLLQPMTAASTPISSSAAMPQPALAQAIWSCHTCRTVYLGIETQPCQNCRNRQPWQCHCCNNFYAGTQTFPCHICMQRGFWQCSQCKSYRVGLQTQPCGFCQLAALQRSTQPAPVSTSSARMMPPVSSAQPQAAVPSTMTPVQTSAAASAARQVGLYHLNLQDTQLAPEGNCRFCGTKLIAYDFAGIDGHNGCCRSCYRIEALVQQNPSPGSNG